MNLALRPVFLLLFTSTGMWLGGCGKSSEPTPLAPPSVPTAPTRIQLLTGAKWRRTGDVYVTTDNGTVSTVDRMLTVPACEKDDFVTITASSPTNFWINHAGQDSCITNFPSTYTLGWNFNPTETHIMWSVGIGGLRIDSLTTKKLVLYDWGVVATKNAPSLWQHTMTYTAF